MDDGPSQPPAQLQPLSWAQPKSPSPPCLICSSCEDSEASSCCMMLSVPEPLSPGHSSFPHACRLVAVCPAQMFRLQGRFCLYGSLWGRRHIGLRGGELRHQCGLVGLQLHDAMVDFIFTEPRSVGSSDCDSWID